MKQTIAVIIPARDAAEMLPGCIAAIQAQERLPDEIWIMVGPSRDGTERIARDLAPPSARVVENRAGDRASALNLAVGDSTANVFAMVDTQSRLEPTYLATALRALDETGAAVVGGPMRPVGRTVVGQAMAAALQSRFGIGNSQFHFAGAGRREVDSVYLGVYRADAFRTVGRYDETLLRTEDDDMNERIRAAGMRIVLDPQIRSTYLCRNKLSTIWSQYHGYGLWKVALFAVRPGAMRLRHLVPALFVLGTAGAAVTTLTAWRPAFPLLAALYAAAGWAASSRVLNASPGARALLPLVTATMHFAYGTGMLRGLRHVKGQRPAVRKAPRRPT